MLTQDWAKLWVLLWSVISSSELQLGKNSFHMQKRCCKKLVTIKNLQSIKAFLTLEQGQYLFKLACPSSQSFAGALPKELCHWFLIKIMIVFWNSLQEWLPKDLHCPAAVALLQGFPASRGRAWTEMQPDQQVVDGLSAPKSLINLDGDRILLWRFKNDVPTKDSKDSVLLKEVSFSVTWCCCCCPAS